MFTDENAGVSARYIRVRNMDYEGKRKSKGRGFRDVRLEEFTRYALGTAQNVLLDMGPHRGGDLLQFINTMQLRYFGHVARRGNNNLEKNCMLGIMEGDRRRGRPRMRWTDGIKKLTGKRTLHEAMSNAQRRDVWNVVIADCHK